MNTVRWVFAEFLLYITNYIVARIPSHRLRLFYYRHVMEFSIGHHTFIFMDASFDCKRGLTIGDNSVINEKCRIDPRGSVRIGNNVNIASQVCILTADHDPRSSDLAARLKPVVIMDNCFIATRAMILPGVTVGKGAWVAAGAVVTRDVPPFTIVGGVPARKIGESEPSRTITTDHCRLFQ